MCLLQLQGLGKVSTIYEYDYLLLLFLNILIAMFKKKSIALPELSLTLLSNVTTVTEGPVFMNTIYIFFF